MAFLIGIAALSIGTLLLLTQAEEPKQDRKVIHLTELTCRTFTELTQQEQDIITAWLLDLPNLVLAEVLLLHALLLPRGGLIRARLPRGRRDRSCWQAVARAPTSREEKRGGVTCARGCRAAWKQDKAVDVCEAPLNKARGRWEQGRPAGIESPDASSTSSPPLPDRRPGAPCCRCCGKAGFGSRARPDRDCSQVLKRQQQHAGGVPGVSNG
jgi:hypothetical protein